MGWDLLSKREIENSMGAIWTATAITAQIAPVTSSTAIWLDGYRVALGTTAQALGVDAPDMRLRLNRPQPDFECIEVQSSEPGPEPAPHIDAAAIRAEAERVAAEALASGQALNSAAARFVCLVARLAQATQGVRPA